MARTQTPAVADTADDRLARLEARLQHFEDAQAIRACVTRYMALCDTLAAATPLDELLDCFTPDATWAGKGRRYGATFGGYQGREAIGEMFRRYMGTPAHFSLNVHFLCNERIVPVGDGRADAEWVMLQTSSFSEGGSHLNAAWLALGMARCDDGRWRIARFETESLFGRPVSHWQSDLPLPVPAAPSPAAA